MTSDSTIDARIPPINRNRQRLQHLRPGAPAERQRDHARDRRQRRHHDRTQPALARLNHALLRRHALRPEPLIRSASAAGSQFFATILIDVGLRAHASRRQERPSS